MRKCPECKEYVANLKTHLKKRHGWKECPACHKAVKDLDKHIIERHNDWTTCPECKAFLKRRNLDRHLRKHGRKLTK